MTQNDITKDKITLSKLSSPEIMIKLALLMPFHYLPNIVRVDQELYLSMWKRSSHNNSMKAKVKIINRYVKSLIRQRGDNWGSSASDVVKFSVFHQNFYFFRIIEKKTKFRKRAFQSVKTPLTSV